MQSMIERQLTIRHSRLSLLSDKLSALGPRQALSRGYAILLDGKTPVTSVDAAKEEMTLLLQDGRMQIRASEIRKEDPFGQETAQL